MRVYELADQYDRVIALGKENLSLFPNSPGLHLSLVHPYLYKGLFKEAFAECKKAAELGAPINHLFQLTCVYALSGEKSKAQDIISGLLVKAKETYIPPYAFACVYGSLGQKDKALEWLEKSYEERCPF
jgi:tetratricopeptide (TPR) repeat protein